MRINRCLLDLLRLHHQWLILRFGRRSFGHHLLLEQLLLLCQLFFGVIWSLQFNLAKSLLSGPLLGEFAFFRIFDFFLAPVPVAFRCELQLLRQVSCLKLGFDSFEHLFGPRAVWKVVLVENFLCSKPIIDFFLTQLLLAPGTEVNNLRGLWVTSGTKVVEKDNNLEVIRYDAAFVLSNVLWAELHLARLDVPVTLLDKCCVEHDPENGAIAEAAVFEYNFDITLERPPFALGHAQLEARRAFFAQVPSLWLISKQQLCIVALALINLKKWEDAITRDGRNFVKFNSAQAFD